eukprot:462261-Pyramimonas_sp.AAC.1
MRPSAVDRRFVTSYQAIGTTGQTGYDHCLVNTARQLQSQGLKAASKSVSCHVYQDWTGQGHRSCAETPWCDYMTAAKHTSHLGVDFGAGARHSREQKTKRNAKHLARHRKVV